jgi:peptidyl-dipeptidase Dcp
MKKINYLILTLFAALLACDSENAKNDETAMNPFFSDYNTPFDIAPFDKIKNEHYMPAFEKGLEEQNKEIEKIVANTEDPSFANTIEALDYSGELLNKVSSVFYNQMSANTNDELQDIAKELAPKMSRHRDEILLNEQLFARVKAVYDQKESLGLNAEQTQLLDKTYKRFARGGANLPKEDRETLKKINEELSTLSLQFGENVLEETNKFKMVIDNEADLAGLPESVIAAAAETAIYTGDSGKWVFTIHRPSLYPFLQYSEKRDLREKLFKAYVNKGDNDNSLDNKKIAVKIANLRVNKAQLLGYKSHADFILEENMAKNSENVYKLMDEVWAGALPTAKKEVSEMQAIIDKEGGNFKLEAWDWWFYAEKLRKQKYDLDEEAIRPYFAVENVRDGAFMVANKVFGINFKELKDVPKPHPDAQAFEVTDADGSHIGILFMDFYPRESKNGGAWMSEYKEQRMENGKMVSPIITNVFNFTKPVGNKPALISFDEASTLFHELGHGLHGLLSKCTYKSLSGTNVSRDFVELPSQIMENWAAHPEVMKLYAKHYETGEVIPDELIKKLTDSQYFNQGFITTEFLSAAFLDMSWHTLTEVNENIDADKFETEALNKIGMIPEIVVRYRTTYFGHIFAGGYSAGYYAYLWAEVLDKDAFEAFKENGIFDSETGMKFRTNILEKGGSEDPMVLYKIFRGAEPNTDALMKGRGFKS